MLLWQHSDLTWYFTTEFTSNSLSSTTLATKPPLQRVVIMASAAASTTATAPSSTSPKAEKVAAAPLSKLYDAALEAEYLKRCIGYSKLCLQCLPEQYDRLDTNRMTAVYFSVASLDMLGHLESSLDKKQIIDWVYAQQVLPDSDSPDTYLAHCGFQGGTFLGKPYGVQPDKYKGGPYDTGNIAMTYTALCTLIMLGDDLSKVNRKAVAAGLAALQQPNGRYSRFVLRACASTYVCSVCVTTLTSWVHVLLGGMLHPQLLCCCIR